MKDTQKAILLALVSISLLGIVTVLVVVSFRELHALERKASRTRDYCSAVSAALDIDARDFASADPEQRLAALKRFGEYVTYHSEPEIALCAKAMPDLRERDACWLAKDFTCLSRLARAASESTKP